MDIEEKTFRDGDLGLVTVRRGPGAIRVSIRVTADRVFLRIPPGISWEKGLGFLTDKKAWILKAQARQRARSEATGTANLDAAERRRQIVEMARRANEWVPKKMSELTQKYGFRVNTLRLKLQKSRWGSCSTRGNINININVMRLPEDCRTYVLLHELSHLVYMNHGPKFHAFLDLLCINETGRRRVDLEAEIRGYDMLTLGD